MSDNVDLWALSDLATPWCVRVVVTLGVAEHMADGVTKVGELARRADCDGESLARVLRRLVANGLFEEPAEDEFTLNEAARVFLEPGPLRGGLNLDGHGGRLAGAWTGLLDAVRSGRPTYQAVFGLPFWEDLDAHPGLADSYDSMMVEGRHVPDPAVLVHDGDWADVRHVVDVGGGTGAMLAEILRARPHVHGTLVDLPRTVARSGEIFGPAGVADRATVAPQSFFEPLPAGADVYLIQSVLLDWPDEEATRLLTRCAEAAAPNGRVVVVGGVSADRAAGKGGLLLMVMTGGKPRSLEEFRVLAAKAGLTVSASGESPSGHFIIESRPS
ncbi:methyltransferase [Streptomyces uncialis]|uniref:methyltransferase n=1 Tax=Streptomyces uncialis TaxID=1048205 RepID=UPI003826E39D